MQNDARQHRAGRSKEKAGDQANHYRKKQDNAQPLDDPKISALKPTPAQAPNGREHIGETARRKWRNEPGTKLDLPLPVPQVYSDAKKPWLRFDLAIPTFLNLSARDCRAVNRMDHAQEPKGLSILADLGRGCSAARAPDRR